MQIQIEAQAVQQALDIITKMAPPLEGEVTFRAKKGRLTAMSVADLSRCTVLVPCKIEGEGEFAVTVQSLRDATKGRTALELKYVEGTLTVKSGSYKALLATLDVIPPDEVVAEETRDWKISGEQAAWLRDVVKEVGLKPTSILSSWMPLGVKLSSGGGFVACYDAQHMSWVNDKSLTGDFEFVLPLELVRSILDVFHASSFTMMQGKGSIKVKNATTSVQLSVPSTEDMPSLEQVRAKIKEAMAEAATAFTLGKKAVATFIDNSRAVVGKERAEIQVSPGAGKDGTAFELMVKTGQGTVKSLVKGKAGKGAKQFRVDLEYLTELLGRVDENVCLNVVTDAFLSIKTKGSHAIVALNQ